jgi:hypothetical protein
VRVLVLLLLDLVVERGLLAESSTTPRSPRATLIELRDLRESESLLDELVSFARERTRRWPRRRALPVPSVPVIR